MINSILKAIFGSRNERTLKRLRKAVVKINALEPAMKALSSEALRGKTAEFRERYEKGTSLNALLPEAFAAVREASVRALGMRHFDVQLIGGIVLHEGNIAEMRTGEGKTLASTLAAYLRAIPGHNVHLVTMNDYLVKRDAEWMRPVFAQLGITVGINLPFAPHEEKKAAYQADITYGTNNEFGFDYLRDNMAFSNEQKVQRGQYFAIVDEVDSILIDEARTPLVISGQTEDVSAQYHQMITIVPQLKKRETEQGEGDYTVDEKQRQVHLTEAGHERVEELLIQKNILQPGESLYDAKNLSLMHYLNACLRAQLLYHRDVHYIVKDNQIVIVDEHTGRTMSGRRWSDGLHQAIEAKEHVKVQNENQTLASITFQNYFRLYQTLSGMTGTADTEAYEFQQIYGLEVVVIPTNRPVQRKDYPDQVYLTYAGKTQAIVKEIQACVKKQQPVLVGTASIEASEHLSQALNHAGIPHEVLNAKQHEREAHIIAQAGRPGAVTIATNMAGRGTDIVLGGNFNEEIAALTDPTPEKIAELKAAWQQRHDAVIQSGGLHIIGSERHESRRIDNQLRGRSGRQGDPGSSRFYLSLEDHLMRIFASPRVAGIMRRLGMKEEDAIEHKLISRAIENAQRKVEAYNFDVRKQLLEFDNVANDQRKVIYEQRNQLLAKAQLDETILAFREHVLTELVQRFVPPESMEAQWDIPGLEALLQHDFMIQLDLQKQLTDNPNFGETDIHRTVQEAFAQNYKAKVDAAGIDTIREFEKSILLQTLDARWKDHLQNMEYLRQGIHLRGYAQKDPKQEYKREAFQLFSSMLMQIQWEVTKIISQVKIQAADVAAMEAVRKQQAERALQQAPAADNTLPRVGRNDPCPCGSGQKYKQCHGVIA